MKRKPGSFLSVLIVVLIGVLALLGPSCGGAVEEPEEPGCSIADDLVLNTDDGSHVTLHADTDIIPCREMAASYVPLDDLPDEECLPCNPEWAQEEEEEGVSEEDRECPLDVEAYAITAIDVTPDGVRFSPPGELNYELPYTWPGRAGDWLFIYQHDPEATCDPDTYHTSWVPVWVDPATVTRDLDRAVGEFDHTCIFLLVDLHGDFNALGKLTQPIELQPDNTLVMSLDVAASSTNPELAGELVTFFFYDTEFEYGTDKLLSLMMELFEPGTTLLIHHQTDRNTVIWSDREVIQFDCEKVGW